jgi:hypothetical protein
MACAAETQELQPLRHHGACDSEQAHHSDGEKGPGGANGEQCAADQRTNYLNRELHSLEDALRAGLLARLSHVTHLCVETGSTGD